MSETVAPSPEDLERANRWKAWIEACFDEISKVAGPTTSKGAQRRIGDFIFCYQSVDVGITDWFVVTNPNSNLPLIHGGVRVRWEQAQPADVVAAILGVWSDLKENPMFILSKRAGKT